MILPPRVARARRVPTPLSLHSTDMICRLSLGGDGACHVKNRIERRHSLGGRGVVGPFVDPDAAEPKVFEN
mgnify:CR=1 FL=1